MSNKKSFNISKFNLWLFIFTIIFAVTAIYAGFRFVDFATKNSIVMGEVEITEPPPYEEYNEFEYMLNGVVLQPVGTTGVFRYQKTYNFGASEFDGINNKYSIIINNYPTATQTTASTIIGVLTMDFYDERDEVTTVNLTLSIQYLTNSTTLTIETVPGVSGNDLNYLATYLEYNALSIRVIPAQYSLQLPMIGNMVSLKFIDSNGNALLNTFGVRGEKYTGTLPTLPPATDPDIIGYYWSTSIGGPEINLDYYVFNQNSSIYLNYLYETRAWHTVSSDYLSDDEFYINQWGAGGTGNLYQDVRWSNYSGEPGAGDFRLDTRTRITYQVIYRYLTNNQVIEVIYDMGVFDGGTSNNLFEKSYSGDFGHLEFNIDLNGFADESLKYVRMNVNSSQLLPSMQPSFSINITKIEQFY